MSTITRPVMGTVPNLNRDEVLLVQRLLNAHRPLPLRQITENGLEGPETKSAIEGFQRRVVKMPHPDGRVDPGGATFRALTAGGVSGPTPAAVAVVFRHGAKNPTGVTGLPGAADKTTATRYESTVTVSGGLSGHFRGSIYPDNMTIKGRLKDGSYDLYLGFHHDGHPSEKDIRTPRTNGFRAVLVVNANRPVPVTSNSPSKHTADGVHVHNGYNTWQSTHPMSEGCLILFPQDWPRFIKLFMDAYPNLADWTAGGGRLGKKIGSVSVTP